MIEDTEREAWLAEVRAIVSGGLTRNTEDLERLKNELRWYIKSEVDVAVREMQVKIEEKIGASRGKIAARVAELEEKVKKQRWWWRH